MTKQEKIKIIFEELDSLLPDARCELFYKRDYELAIAVMLSAQTTDKKVNSVTSVLFTKYPSLDALSNASISEIENLLRPLGMYQVKAKNTVGIAKELLVRFDGKLPSNKDELMTLPGIGNKSAGVIRAEVFNIPDLAVDTHILRLSYRFGFNKKDEDPYVVEQTLKKLLPQDKWIKAHHQLIHFGRYYCLARNPHCLTCKLKNVFNKK